MHKAPVKSALCGTLDSTKLVPLGILSGTLGGILGSLATFAASGARDQPASPWEALLFLALFSLCICVYVFIFIFYLVCICVYLSYYILTWYHSHSQPLHGKLFALHSQFISRELLKKKNWNLILSLDQQ